MKLKKIIVSGKRKRAVARAILIPGTGKITINKRNYNNFHLVDKL
ncbi:MAG: 30S ribosomal protein S9 [Bacteroidetes bacterium]|nr:30S ribosomal protein S9 [Bacteroidota bacterium]